MYVAVCDDNNCYMDKISGFLEHYYNSISSNVVIERFGSGENLLDDIGHGKSFDVVFLGVERNGGIGIETAYRLREMNYRNDLVLTSSNLSCAIDGYFVKASGYMLKSWKYESMTAAMDNLDFERISGVYSLKQRSRIVNLYHNDIVCVESSNSKCIIRMSNGEEFVVYKHLSEIENELPDDMFLRCHRSFIVNMNYIESVGREFVLKNGYTVLIRQKSLKEMKERFMDFLKKVQKKE